MAMDRFTEQVVIKQKRTMNEILYMLALLLMVVSGLVAFMLLQVIFRGFNIYILLMLLLSGGVAALLYFYRDRLRTEYEYTFTNGDLDFAMVFNNNKRKTLGSLKVRNVTAFGKVSGNDFKRYITMPGVKKNNWFLNREAELYYFYFEKEDKKRIIVLEPNEEVVSYIKHYLPQGALKA